MKMNKFLVVALLASSVAQAAKDAAAAPVTAKVEKSFVETTKEKVTGVYNDHPFAVGVVTGVAGTLLARYIVLKATAEAEVEQDGDFN